MKLIFLCIYLLFQLLFRVFLKLGQKYKNIFVHFFFFWDLLTFRAYLDTILMTLCAPTFCLQVALLLLQAAACLLFLDDLLVWRFQFVSIVLLVTTAIVYCIFYCGHGTDQIFSSLFYNFIWYFRGMSAIVHLTKISWLFGICTTCFFI